MFDHWNAYQADPAIRLLAEDWATTPWDQWPDGADQLNEWLHTDPHKALAAICAVVQMTSNRLLLAPLAAGPLEDWLCLHGETMLDLIETLAQEQENFRSLLGGVWQNSMSKVLFQKVRAMAVGRL